MHPNPAFRKTPHSLNVAFARERAFGMLAVNDAAGPLASHVPFLLSEDGGSAQLHLVRSNPIARLCATPQPAVLAVLGPDGYISPDWYGMDDQVPTWNYVAVHLRGTLHRAKTETLDTLLERQSDFFERRLLPKTPWRPAKVPKGEMEKMMRMILPFRLEIVQVDGTWKLNQNKPEDVRRAAARHVAVDGYGHEVGALASLMRDPPGD
ncbi:MAG: FMN-binding negative transcriptional regulator [Pseudomonadota bacterium]